MRRLRRGPFTPFDVAGAYAGTVVGAGFASGQEILRFFTAFGSQGSLGLALATILFILLGGALLRLGFELRARSHRDVLLAAGGPWFGHLADAVVTGFLFAATSVMMAGSGAIAREQFGWPQEAGSLALAAAAALTVLFGLGGVVRATALVAPVLAASVAVLSVLTLLSGPGEGGTESGPGLAAAPTWWLAGLLYASYNTVLAMSVLAPLGRQVADPRVRRLGAVWGALTLGATAMLIHAALRARLADVAGWQVPMLELARERSPAAASLYALVLWAEVYTTAVGGLFGVAARLADPARPAYRATVLLLTLAALALSRFGFARLVATVYPLVGYVGLITLALAARLAWRSGRRPA